MIFLWISWIVITAILALGLAALLASPPNDEKRPKDWPWD